MQTPSPSPSPIPSPSPLPEPWRAPVDGVVTSLFGARINPVLQTVEVLHNGIDLAADIGTPAVAVADAEITAIGESATYGLYVKYKTTDGYEIMYAHLSKTIAAVGEKVSRGGTIALTGNTGLTTGPHLHYTIWKDGNLLDPIDFLP